MVGYHDMVCFQLLVYMWPTDVWSSYLRGRMILALGLFYLHVYMTASGGPVCLPTILKPEMVLGTNCEKQNGEILALIDY